jgi:indolepyruvate ferredoxin oxidoreductase
MMSVFKVLTKLKRLRGTPFDIFGYSEDRKLERQLLADYEQLVEELLKGLDARNHEAAVELALLPAQMRGFGHVKHRHVKHAQKRQTELLQKFRSKAEPTPPTSEGVEHSVVIMAG